MKYQILQGDNRATLKTIPDNSIDAIVTDPPYGIDFLGKSWDANTGALETYQECLRVLKPGGHILAFSAARTYHHLAITLEQAGFEIRDQIMWIYSSGFPKSQDVGKQIHKKENGKLDKQKFDPGIMIKVDGDNYKHPDTNKVYRKLPDINGDNLAKSHEGNGYGCVFQEVVEVNNEWSGWGTALKPAHEPIALARKPIKTSIRENVLKYGTGALNIDATRVPYNGPNDKPVPHGGKARLAADNEAWHKNNTGWKVIEDPQINQIGRFPSNVLGEIDEPYQKYFYCPKVSRGERHVGHELPESEPLNSPDQVRNHPLWDPSIGTNAHRLKEKIRQANGDSDVKGNNHPTVKPIELMKYLIKLITPPGGTVLDPFNGSGSTGCAAVELGHPYIGCELDEKYVEIAEKRIEAWYAECNPTTFNTLFEQAA